MASKASRVNRRGGDRRRRAGRADRGDRAGRGRRRDRADRAAAGRRPSHHRAAGGLGHGAGHARRLGAAAAAQAAPLRVMRIVDDTARLIRAPEVQLRRGRDRARRVRPQHREPASAGRARRARARACRRCSGSRTKPARSRPATDGVTIRLRAGGTRHGAARRSAPTAGARSAAPPPASRPTARSYPQTALTFNLAPRAAAPRHLDRIPHRERAVHAGAAAGRAIEPGLRGRAGRGASASPRSTTRRWRTRSSGARIRSSARSRSSRAAARFPLAVETARQFARNRIALIGEAAHRHPADRRAGPQSRPARRRDHRRAGGRRRAATAATSARPTCSRATTPRAAPTSRAARFAVDLLNRTLLSDFLPVQGARGLGLYLIDRIGPLRRAVLREGVAPAASQPRLMRGEAL